MRKLAYKSRESYETYKPFIETRPPEIVANILICLVNKCNYLLDRQITRLEKDFLVNDGLREAMYRAGVKNKNAKNKFKKVF